MEKFICSGCPNSWCVTTQYECVPEIFEDDDRWNGYSPIVMKDSDGNVGIVAIENCCGECGMTISSCICSKLEQEEEELHGHLYREGE